MKVTRIGDTLLRSRQPLLPFLAPSAWSREPSFRLSARPLQQSITWRCLATQTLPLQSASTSTAEKSDDADGFTPQAGESQHEPLSEADQKKALTEARLHSLLDSLPGHTKISRPPTRNSKSQSSYEHNSASRMRQAMSKNSWNPETRAGNIAGSMKFGVSKGVWGDESISEAVSGIANRHTPLPPLPPPVRLDAFVGRSELVNARNNDLGNAFKRLEMKCRENNVKRDFQRQRFHERPGLKRKRLKSERWRKRFKLGFQAIIQKVHKMRSQGW